MSAGSAWTSPMSRWEMRPIPPCAFRIYPWNIRWQDFGGKKIKNIRLVGAWIKIEDRGQGFRFQGMITPPAPSGAKR